jgi:TfoX/Sxy family transcriptional regulator of competence genes
MSEAHATAEERYESLCRTLLDEPAVTRESGATQQRTGFGSSALKVDDKIFAMLVNGRLVVKLPRHAVEALVASGEGERYDPGRGRLMKEWVALESQSEEQWLRLAKEALEFVARRSAA